MQLAISDLQGPPVIENISALARSTLTKKIALGSSLNGLSTDALTVQIGSAEPPSFVFVCIEFLWGKFRWAWLRNGST